MSIKKYDQTVTHDRHTQPMMIKFSAAGRPSVDTWAFHTWTMMIKKIGKCVTHGKQAMGNPTLLLVFLKASILSGKHSDQGSMIPEIHQDIRSRKKISGHSDRVLAQNFDTVLAGIVIWAGEIIFAKCCQEV